MTIKVFLSHNSKDKPQVERLAERLEDAGFHPWLDSWNLVPGDPWQPELEKALLGCDCCLVFLGQDPLGPWQNEEMQVVINRRANDKRFRVIPVLLPKVLRGKRGDVPAFLANATWVEFRHNLEEAAAFERLLCGIRGESPRRRRSATVSAECPYRGLRSFDIGDAEDFYGREALTGWLVAEIRRMIQSDREPRFLAIVGPSGSGKSSVARAGLLHELEQGGIEGSEHWPRIVIDHPGEDPLAALANKGAQALGLPELATVRDPQFTDVIKSETDKAKYQNKLHGQAESALANQPGNRLLVFVDQFEEIFTACTNAEWRRRFVDLLLFAARAHRGPVVVVITIRLDFLGKCIEHEGLAGIISGGMQLVGPMTDDELDAAILCPAGQAGVTISSTLVNTLKQTVRRQPGSLPLMEHVLEQLWNKRQQPSTIDEADLAQPGIGGIEGSLARHADEILDTRCQPAEVRERTLALLTRLVHISNPALPDTDTRARCPIDDADHRLLQPFIDAHLLVTSDLEAIRDGQVVNHGQRLVEVAHEALIRDWPTLKQAVQPKREFLAWRETIRHDLEQWLKLQGQPEAAQHMLEGRDLSQARQWLKNPAVDFEPNEREFIAASFRQARRRLIVPGLGLAAALAVLLFLGWVATTRHTFPVARDLLLAHLGIYWFVAPEMVAIPTGQFLMGSVDSDTQATKEEKPAHAVTIKPFKLGRYETTFDEYTAYVLIAQTEPNWRCSRWQNEKARKEYLRVPETIWDRGRRPVINVSWDDAQCYAEWLSQKTGQHYRLPTEAEWEYAARGGTTTVYWWGNDIRQDNMVWANCVVCGSDWDNKQTAPVGSFPANGYGLHDTAGNVDEWVADCAHWSYQGAPTNGMDWEDAKGCASDLRVTRGGSWIHYPKEGLRSAARTSNLSINRSDFGGFRLAQDSN